MWKCRIVTKTSWKSKYENTIQYCFIFTRSLRCLISNKKWNECRFEMSCSTKDSITANDMSEMSHTESGAGSTSGCVLLGVTPPISTAPPTPDDEARSDRLRAALNALDVYETRDGMARRERVLARLAALVQQWATDDIGDNGSGGGQAHVFTYGSYRLGVATRGAGSCRCSPRAAPLR